MKNTVEEKVPSNALARIWIPVLASLASVVVFFSTAGLAWAVDEATSWELVKSKAGAEVLQRPVADSRFKATKGILLSKARLFDALAVLRDVDACDEWLHKCKHGEVVSSSSRQSVYYTVIDSPFVLKDRDSYVRSTIEYDPLKESLHIDMLGVEDTRPPHKKRVRVLDFKGSWLLEQHDSEHIRLTYQVHMDPQVSTVGAANSTLATSVLETLLNVDRLAVNAPYLNSPVSTDQIKAITRNAPESN